MTPGGYLLNTNASLQTQAEVDAETADRFAAAAGYVFRQWSVLVSDFGAEDGGTGYGVVSFEDGTLDAGMAHAFFEHAASIADGLGGGLHRLRKATCISSTFAARKGRTAALRIPTSWPCWARRRRPSSRPIRI